MDQRQTEKTSDCLTGERLVTKKSSLTDYLKAVGKKSEEIHVAQKNKMCRRQGYFRETSKRSWA